MLFHNAAYRPPKNRAQRSEVFLCSILSLQATSNKACSHRWLRSPNKEADTSVVISTRDCLEFLWGHPCERISSIMIAQPTQRKTVGHWKAMSLGELTYYLKCVSKTLDLRTLKTMTPHFGRMQKPQGLRTKWQSFGGKTFPGEARASHAFLVRGHNCHHTIRCHLTSISWPSDARWTTAASRQLVTWTTHPPCAVHLLMQYKNVNKIKLFKND